MFTEKVNVYRFSGVGPLGDFAPAGDAAAGGPAVGFAAPPGAAPGAAPAATAGVEGTLPNMNERLMLRLTEKKPGPMPKLRGMRRWLGRGFKSKSPNLVRFKSEGSVLSVANAGRSVNNPSPFVSRPVTILNGRPLE